MPSLSNLHRSAFPNKTDAEYAAMEEQDKVITAEERDYAIRVTPLFVALRRYLAWIEEEFWDPNEMQQYLHAKSLFMDITERLSSETVGPELDGLIGVMEESFDQYLDSAEEAHDQALKQHEAPPTGPILGQEGRVEDLREED